MPDETSPSTEKIAELERRLAAEPSSRVFLDLARALHEAGQLGKAADVCASGVEKHPGWLSARVLFGRICFDMGRLEDSRRAMEHVLDAAPDNLVARRVLAEICLEQGDREGALDRFRALLAFNPADTETRNRIERIEAGDAVEEPQPPPQAAATQAPPAEPARPGPAAAPVTEARPEPRPEPARDAGVLATPTLAEIYLQQGLTGQAIEVYREILQGDPRNHEAAARLAEIEASIPARPDPLVAARRRKIEALTGWLEAMRGGRHA